METELADLVAFGGDDGAPRLGGGSVAALLETFRHYTEEEPPPALHQPGLSLA